MRLRKYSIEQLRVAVATSGSMRQVLTLLNVIPAGGNYEVLRKAIRHWNLDTSHFSGRQWNRGLKTGFRRPIEHYLREDIHVQTSRLAGRLLREGRLARRCGNCALDSWQGNPIPLELHHVNGSRSDNRLENLVLLCPNCHALTPTYRGKNRSRA